MSDGTLVMENARIIFRNFAGKEGQYNREGDRNFCVLLEPHVAEQMEKDGWNVKALRAREPGDPDQPYLQVSVSFKIRPPKIVMITSKGRTTLTEAECEVLDWVDVRIIDLIVRPYEWSVGGKSGVKAYLKSFFVTIEEDELELKYAEVPELDQLPARAGRVDEGHIIEGEIVEQYAIGGRS
jgi:hypothetical protein